MSFSAPQRIAGVVAAVAIFATIAVVSPASAAPRRDRTPPTAPSNLRVTGLTMTSVSLAWNPSTDDSGVFSYSVNKDGQGFTVPQAQTSYTINWLSPGQTYRFFVTAVDRALNTSAPSNAVTVTTPRDTTPPTAPVLTATVRGPSQVALSWTKSTDDVATWVSYGILVNGTRATQHVNWWGERSVVLRHLAPATSYTFTVQAFDASGNVTPSNTVTLTTASTTDVTPPSAPTNLRLLEDQGCAEVWLGFTQSVDDFDPQSAIEYEVYVNGVLSPLAVGAGIDREFVYGTVNGNNTFTVKAVDQAGNTSAASNAITTFLWLC